MERETPRKLSFDVELVNAREMEFIIYVGVMRALGEVTEL